MADNQSQDTSASNTNTSNKSVDNQLKDIQAQIAEIPRPDKDAPIEDQRAYRKSMNEFSAQAAKLRAQQIAADDSLDAKEKKVLTLYNQGMQIFAIAQKVYDFANRDTVGKVTLVIRKAHASDFNEIEDIESTKGYTGIGVNA